VSRHNRRSFLKRTLAAAATITIAGTKSTGRVLGANDAIRVAIAGLHGRGSAHVGGLAGMKGVQVTHLIDPDSRTFAARVTQVRKLGGNDARTVADVREVLALRNVDVLTIAAPNHWHSLMTIWACQAGKDVYVEKPCSHNVHEGRIAAETARRYNRIVQHGTQSRSSASWQRIVEVIRSGKLGRLRVSRGLCYKPRGTIGTRANSKPPDEVDFNLWLGPAATQAHHANLVHYNWHWFWDFGNGDIGNQGVHQMDIARWGIPGATLPRSVLGLGGRFGYSDQGETPNTQMAIFDFGETQLIFEVRGLRTEGLQGQSIGNIFYLEEGTIAGNQFFPRGQNKPAPLPEVKVPARPGGGDHFANFIAAVRSRRREDLNADILEGHYSSALCHLANISYRLGENVAFDPRTQAVNGNKEATETLQRMEDHLRVGNELRLSDLRLRVGRRLTVDAKQENFGSKEDAANRLLTRQYRSPFTVPARVD
jgi:predicted dehydrogenase